MYTLPSCCPLVSVIIPTYNREFCIGRAITSVINQTFTEWEIIIVDNNSTDKTDEIINEFRDDRISVVKIHNNGIVAKSRNLGIKLAKGSLIAFLDSDDWWAPKKLEIAIQQIASGSDVVYHELYRVTKNSTGAKKQNRIFSRKLSSPVFVDLLSNGNTILNSSVVLRRKLLEEIEGFSEEKDLLGSEDFDGWLRISKLSENFEKLDGVFGYYWDGGGNLTSAKLTIKNTLFLYKKYAHEFSLIGSKKMPGWMAYSLARATLDIGDFSRAREYSLLTLKSSVPLKVWIKAVVNLVLSFLKLKL